MTRKPASLFTVLRVAVGDLGKKTANTPKIKISP